MKKVLHYVSKMDRAGQETFIMNMYRNINRENFQFGFLCSSEGKADYDDEIMNLGGQIFHFSLSTKKGKIKQYYNYKILKKELTKYRDEYEVFHIHTFHAFDAWMAASAAKKAGFKKVAVHSHNTCADAHVKMHILFKKILSRMKIIKLACSDAAGKWMYSTDEYEVINNAIDTEIFAFNPYIRTEYRKKLGVEDKYVIGHIARFEEQKNHEYVVEIIEQYAKSHSDFIVLFIGRGSKKDKIEKLCKEKRIEKFVRFLGARDDVAQIYQALDLFILPSKYEGLPVTLVEAQMTGVNCLISDCITEEIDLTTNVYRCSNMANPREWGQMIDKCRNRKSSRKSEFDAIRDGGYDITFEVKKLEKKYSE